MVKIESQNFNNLKFHLEFLMLTLNKEKMLSKEKLEKAFKLFDEVNKHFI